MILGVVTGNIDYVQAATQMSEELRETANHPSIQQMTKYAFIGSKETINEKIKQFLKETHVDEVIVASHIYEHQDRVKSYQIFAEVMQEL